MEEIYMSRFYNNCVDEASLTTLCPICLDSFQGAKGVRVRRADPKQKIKDVCTFTKTCSKNICTSQTAVQLWNN